MNCKNMLSINLLINKAEKKFSKQIKSVLKKSLFVISNIFAISTICSNAFSSYQVVPRSVIALPNTQALLSTGSGLDRGNLPIGAVQLGYFIIPNGASLNTVPNNSPLTFQNITSSGWIPLYNSVPLRGANSAIYFSDLSLNIDHFPHLRITNGTLDWEDQISGGDLSYQNVLINASIQRTDLTSNTISNVIPLVNGYHAVNESMKFNLSLNSLGSSSTTGYNNSFGHYFRDISGNILSGGLLDFANVRTDAGKATTIIPYSGITAFTPGETLQYTKATTVISDIEGTNIAAVDVSLSPLSSSSPKLQLNNSASLGSVKDNPGRIDNLLAVTISPNITLTLTGTGGTFYDGSSVGVNNYSGLGTIDGTASGNGNLLVNNPAANISLTQKIGSIAPINSVSIFAGTLSSVNDINMTGNLTIDQADANNVGNLVLNGSNNTMNLTAGAIFFTGNVNQPGGSITLDSSNGAQNFNFNVGQVTSPSTFKGTINLNANNNPIAFGSTADIGNSGNGALHAINISTNNGQNVIVNPNSYSRGYNYSGTGFATFNNMVNIKSNTQVSPARTGSFNINGTGNVLFNQGLSSVAADGVTGNLIYTADGTAQIAANKNLNANAYATGTANIGTVAFLGGNSIWYGTASGPEGSLPIKTILAGAGNLTLQAGTYNINQIQGTGTGIITLPDGTIINGNFNSTGGQKINLDVRGNVVLNGKTGSQLSPVGNIKLTAPNTNITLQGNAFANQLEFQGITSTANLYGMLNSNVLFTSGGTLNINNNNAGVSGDINGNGKIIVNSNLTNVNLNGSIGNIAPINSINVGASSTVNLNSDVRFNNPNGAAVTIGQNAILTFIGDRNITGTNRTEYIKGAANDNGALVFSSGNTNLYGVSMGVNGGKLNSITVLNNSVVTTDSNINVEKLQIGDATAPATLIIKPQATVSEIVDSFTLAHPNSTYQIDSSNANGGLVFSQNTNTGVTYDSVGTIILNANNYPLTINGTGAFGDSDTQRVKKIILMGNAGINLNVDTHAVQIIDATPGNVVFNGAFNHTGTPVDRATILTINNANRIDINADRQYSIIDYQGNNAEIRIAEGVTLTAPLADSTNQNTGTVEFVGNGHLVGSDHSIPSGIGLLKAGAAGTTVTISNYETIKDVQGISDTGTITFDNNAVLTGSINLNGGAASTINFSSGGYIGSIGAGAPVGNINLNGAGTMNFLLRVRGSSLNIRNQGAIAKIYDDLLAPVNFVAPGTLEIALSDVDVTKTIDGAGNIIVDPNLQNVNFNGNIGSISPVNSLQIGAGSTVSVKGNVTTNGAATVLGDDSKFIVNNNNVILNTIINAKNAGNGKLIVNSNLTGVVFNRPIGLDAALDNINIGKNSQVTANASTVANSTTLMSNATLNFGKSNIIVGTPIDGEGNVQVNDNVNYVYFSKPVGGNIGINKFTIGTQASAILTNNLSVNSNSNLDIILGNQSNFYVNGTNITVDGKIDGPGSITVGNAPIEANFVHSSHVVFNKEIGNTNALLYFALSDDSSARFNKTANFTNDIIVGDNSLVQFADNLTADFINFTNNSGSIEFINPNPMQVTALIGLEANHPKNMIVSGNDVTINSGQTLTNAITFSNSKMPATLSLINATVYNGGIYTTGDLIHTIAFGNTSIIGTGDVGGPNNRLKIELFRQNINAGFGLVVNSKDFYANVTTKEANNGALFFSGAEGIALNIGTPDAKLQGVYVNENIEAKGNIYSNELRVRGKTVSFTGESAIINSDQILLNSSSQLLFKGDNAKVTSVINSNLGTDTTITVDAHNITFNSLIGNTEVIRNFIMNQNSSATLNENISLSSGGIQINSGAVLALASNSNIFASNGAVIDFMDGNGTLNVTRTTSTRIDAPIKANNSGSITANNLGLGDILLINGPIGSVNDNQSLSLLQATGGSSILLTGGDAYINNIDMGTSNASLILNGSNSNYKFKLSHQNDAGKLLIYNNARLKQGTNISSFDNPLYEVNFTGDNRLILESIDLYAKNGINTTASGQGILEFAGSSTVGSVIGKNNSLNSILISDSNNVVTFLDKINLTNNLTINPNNTARIKEDTIASNIESTGINQGIVEFINNSPITVKANVGANNRLNKVIMSNRSVSVTGGFGSNEIDFTNANQVSALKILGNADLSNVNVYTNSNIRAHNVHTSNILTTINGNWGSADHLMGGIHLTNSNAYLKINTLNFFGGVNVSTDNTGIVEFTKKGSRAYELGRFDGEVGGTHGYSLKKVIFSEDATSYGVTKSQTIEVADGVTATFSSGQKIQDPARSVIRPHIISEKGMTLGLGSSAVLTDNALLDGPIIAKQSGSGDVYFHGRAEVRGLIGTPQNKINSVNFNGINNRDAVRLVKDISANNINLDNVAANIAYTIRLNGAVNAHNVNLDLNNEILILPSSVATLTGDIGISTTFDGVQGGHITAQGQGATLNFSNANSMVITVNADTQLANANDEVSYILFLESQGGQVRQNNPNNIQVISNDINRYVHWIYNSADRKLIGGLHPSVVIDDIMNNNSGANGDDMAIANYLAINADSPAINTLLNMLGRMSREEVLDTIKRIQPDTNNIPSTIREDIASVDTLITGRIDRIINSNITETQEGSGVAAGGESMDYGLWFGPFYDRANQRMRESKSGYKASSYGTTIGYDTKIDDLLSIGGGISYVDTHIKHQDAKIGDKTKVNSIVLSLYGIKEFLNDCFVQANGSASYSLAKNSERRNIGSNIGVQANSKYHVNSYSAQALAGYDYRITRSFMATPSIGVRYDRFGQISYRENGAGVQNLTVKKKATNRLEGIIGGKLTLAKQVKEILVIPELHSFINYNFLNKAAALRVNLAEAPAPLPITTIKQTRVSYNLGGGIEASRGIFELGLVYDAVIEHKYTSHQGTLRVRVSL